MSFHNKELMPVKLPLPSCYKFLTSYCIGIVIFNQQVTSKRE